MKKFLSTFLALAVVIGAGVCFTACGKTVKVEGKTAKFNEVKYTFVTETEEKNGETVVKTTVDYTADQIAELAFKMEALGKTYTEAKEYTITEADKTANNYKDYIKSAKETLTRQYNGEIKFEDDKCSFIQTNNDSKSIINGTYEIEEKGIRIFMARDLQNAGTDYETIDAISYFIGVEKNVGTWEVKNATETSEKVAQLLNGSQTYTLNNFINKAITITATYNLAKQVKIQTNTFGLGAEGSTPRKKILGENDEENFGINYVVGFACRIGIQFYCLYRKSKWQSLQV